jgi:hypothetical protein
MPVPPQTPTGAGNSSAYALHVAGTSCNEWGFDLATLLNAKADGIRCPYDASVYDGVYFWAKADSESKAIHFYVDTQKTVPVNLGGDGTCDDAAMPCWDGYAKNLVLTDTWTLYEVRWTELAQLGWGAPAAFDSRILVQMGWDGAVNVTTDFWIDQIGFFSGSAPTAPPSGSGGASGAGP